MAKKNESEKMSDRIEEMILRYNKKPEKAQQKRDIVSMLRETDLILPAKVGVADATVRAEVIKGVSISPDVVKDSSDKRLVPAFTSLEQIPDDYKEKFSLLKMQADIVFSYMNECDDIRGIVVNPFTECNIEVPKKNGVSREKKAKVSKVSASADSGKAIIIYNNKKYEIGEKPFTIGRENANITIPQSYISKIHAVITLKDGRYRIADYDSTNGTVLDGTPLRPKVYYELRDGYEIELAGREKMLIYIN